MTQITMRCDHSPRARHSSMQVMLALQSITTSKASDGDIMAVELFQILQDDAVEVLHSICSKFGKISRGRSGKGQFSLQSQRKAMPKKCSIYYTIALISHTSKELLKNLQAMLQQYMNQEIPDVQAGFRKGKRTTDQIANIVWIIEKARELQKKHLPLLY